MNPTATLSSKYQISIPKAIRAAQHWEAGVTFAFIPKGTGVLLVPVPRLETLKGIARGASVTAPHDLEGRSVIPYSRIFLVRYNHMIVTSVMID